MSEERKPEKAWAFRLTERAQADTRQAWQHFAATASDDDANLWEDGHFQEIARLDFMPDSRPRAEEDALFSIPIRKLIYRRHRNSPDDRI